MIPVASALVAWVSFRATHRRKWLRFLFLPRRLAYLDQVSDALRQYLLSLPEGAMSRPTLFVGERLTAYQVIKEIVLGCVGHLGEIEALKALQIRAKQRPPERSG